MKTGIKCGKAKPLDDFYRAAGMRDGYRNDCKGCMKLVRRAWYERNRDYAIERTKRWRDRNPEKFEAWKQRNRDENRQRLSELNRQGHLRRKYGLTVDDYEFLRVAQGDACAICGNPDPSGLHVDHHHESGLIRGLLCGKCNKAIGLLKEDPALFDAASSYLQRTQLPLGCGDKTRPPTRVRRRIEQPSASEDK